MEKVSEKILKGNTLELLGIDPAEIIVPFNNDELNKLWEQSEHRQSTCSNFLGETNNNYPIRKRIQLIKKANWILPHIIQDIPITEASTFYTDENNKVQVSS